MPNNPQHSKVATRIRKTYAARKQSPVSSNYAWNSQEEFFFMYRRLSLAGQLLTQIEMTNLSDAKILDVGCGTGGWLTAMLNWGASPSNLYGTDLLEDAIQTARIKLPNSNLQFSEGWPLPFKNDSMNLVTANTVLSSIIEDNARQDLASEMVRVTANNGCILIYDFRISHPSNPNTIGISIPSINNLFPNWTINRRTLYLAPPISRKIIRFSPMLVHLIETLCPFLRSHAMYLLTRS